MAISITSREDVTAVTPIRLSTYYRRQGVSRMRDDARLTPEWKAWYDERVGRQWRDED